MFVFLIYFLISSTYLFLYFNYLKILYSFYGIGSGKMLALYIAAELRTNETHHHTIHIHTIPKSQEDDVKPKLLHKDRKKLSITLLDLFGAKVKVFRGFWF